MESESDILAGFAVVAAQNGAVPPRHFRGSVDFKAVGDRKGSSLFVDLIAHSLDLSHIGKLSFNCISVHTKSLYLVHNVLTVLSVSAVKNKVTALLCHEYCA